MEEKLFLHIFVIFNSKNNKIPRQQGGVRNCVEFGKPVAEFKHSEVGKPLADFTVYRI